MNLFDTMMSGRERYTESLAEHTQIGINRILNVSSAIPSSEVAGTGRHSQDETGPGVLGGFSTADCGPATVGILYPVTCAARYYDAASRILEDEPHLHTHDNADELGHVIQRWIEETRDNYEPR